MQRSTRLLFTAVILLMAAYSTRVQAQTYKLLWSDEFDGSTVNLFKWTMETGNNNGWGNSELENYTNRTQNAYVDSGMLVIKAIKESYGGYGYTSARMKTQGHGSWKYGKIEARMKLPYGQGIWPAFWMLGDNITTVSWPKCGEIDIMEMVGGADPKDRTLVGTAHWDNGGHQSQGGSTTLPSGKFADSFHNFAIIWSPDNIIWTLDDVPYKVVVTSTSDRAAFQKSFFIILNLAVGGQWPGSPDASTVFPQMMYVDYVRVYGDVALGVSEENTPPSTYALAQNYPNPFNPSTTIAYSIPAAGPVSLEVFNVLGSRVATLVNKTVDAGAYTAEWDARTEPSGVYFYRLTAGSFVETKRLVIQK